MIAIPTKKFNPSDQTPTVAPINVCPVSCPLTHAPHHSQQYPDRCNYQIRHTDRPPLYYSKSTEPTEKQTYSIDYNALVSIPPEQRDLQGQTDGGILFFL